MISKAGKESARPYHMVARAQATQSTFTRLLEEAVSIFTERPYNDVSLEEIARRAGVTKRTVLRRFGSKEALFAEAMDTAAREMMRHRGTAPVGDLSAAIANLLEHYERWGENRLRLLQQEDAIPVVRENVRGGRAFHWSWVEKTFAPLIAGHRGSARRRRIAALVVLTDVYTWKLLRRDLELSREETERLLVEMISRLERQT